MSSMWLARRARPGAALLRAQRPLSTASSSGYALRSNVWIPTEKEVPADAAIPSHQLLVRGGFIRKSGHGVFTFLPLGKRVASKLEAIIDDEMARIGGNKLDLPLLIPAELWEQSGRWQTRGPELMTFADRRDALHALAPTHEESITSLVAQHFNYNNSAHGSNTSLRLYQVGKKFRDEIRPRFGLLRAREFVMKDMYSFDTSFAKAIETYDDVVRAYEAILKTRLKLPIAKVEADSGNIGGNLSHEFHVVADIGEDAILSCASHKCGYAANVEKAVGVLPPDSSSGGDGSSNADVSEALADIHAQIDAGDLNAWKSLVAVAVDAGLTCKVLREPASATSAAGELRWALVFARQDREVNELSLKSFFGGEELDEVSLAALEAHDFKTQETTGEQQLSVFMDDSLEQDRLDASNNNSALTKFLWSAAESHADQKLVALECGHFRMAQEGDGCPRCSQSHLEAKRGIEVGHVFYLGQKYSKPFDVTFLDTSDDSEKKTDKPVKKVMEMGCFGMGVSRLIASAVEVSHDPHGIIWPVAIAPYKVIVMAIGSKRGDEPISLKAIEIAQELASGSIGPALAKGDVILDDRWRESPGSKLAESELLGYPFRIVVGKRFAKEGLVEVQVRATLEKTFLPPSEIHAYFADKAAQGEL